MMRRRALLGAPLLALLPPTARAFPAEGYRFRLMREGREIGTHTVRSEPGGVTRTAVTLEVKLLSFTVFRMTHEYAERWQGGALVGFAARTVRNGDEGRLNLVATADGLRGEGPEGAVRLPAEAAPLSWWAPAHLERPLFDTATGKPLPSAPQRSRQGALTRWEWPERGMVALYDAAGTWVAFSMRGDDGSTVRYETA
ncbi:hypothetical protein E0493_07330 [Roseomonas sp. M0104]|uniref:DUF3108 domain-containing protein n=1 Tax=Teichococcus coralli TaxID=2545983 RepID=A0A845B8V0_9PROT|nr:DUF6134 family protein [Pseudoroseomonas coralli]MXP63165.1 hypothetical protein [Pseudoroseomonas coralli]